MIICILSLLLFAIIYDYMLYDYILFIKTMGSATKTTGSICPSSKYLSSNLIKHTQGPNIALIGCGTGAIIEAIVAANEKFTSIDIIEINEQFYDYCRKKYDNNNKITFIHKNILDHNIPIKYDSIITTIPHKLFNSDEIDNFTKKYMELSDKIIMYEYILGGTTKSSLTKFFEQNKEKGKNITFEYENIICNIPPASIRIVNINKDTI